jgi:hypothetical protein
LALVPVLKLLVPVVRPVAVLALVTELAPVQALATAQVSVLARAQVEVAAAPASQVMGAPARVELARLIPEPARRSA